MVLSEGDRCTCLSFGQYLALNFIEKNVGIPIGTNFAPLVADLYLFCYERDIMKSLTEEKQYDMIDAFNSTSRYLNDLLNIDNVYFEQIGS